MVTKADLILVNEQRAEKAARKAVERKAVRKKEREYRLIKHMAKVDGLLDGELGELLEKLNAEGLTNIRLGIYRVWKPQKRRGGWGECYGNSSPLGFGPRKDYPPTMKLVHKLRKAGFSVKLEVEQHQNCEYRTTADGYDAVSVPGTHPVYYMRITW